MPLRQCNSGSNKDFCTGLNENQLAGLNNRRLSPDYLDHQRVPNHSMRTLLASSTVLLTIVLSLAFGIACGYAVISAILHAFAHRPEKRVESARATAVVATGVSTR